MRQRGVLINKYKKLIPYLYLLVTYLLIFSQYPASVSIGQVLFHQNITDKTEPAYLLIWGLIRLVIVLPLIFTLLVQFKQTKEDIYLRFGDAKKVIAITFWGTFIFTLLSIYFYPHFLVKSSLTTLTFIGYLPFFLIYSVSNAFAEETFFRGAGLNLLENKYSFWIANIIQASFFGIIHYINPISINPLSFVALTFFLGLLWGYLTKKTKSLIPAIALHVIADIFVAISLF